MTQPRKAPRRTRERILELSLRLFNDFGEPNVTTTTISDEMNISPGNLYYHFRNKDDIVNAIFKQFEQELEPLLEAPAQRATNVEDVWLFLHLLFELIWRYRFLYRDLNDLLSRNRTLETRFKQILNSEIRLAASMCRGLRHTGEMEATDAEIEAMATNMVVVATYWLSFEYVREPRKYNEPEHISQSLARGAYHVLAMGAPMMRGASRQLFEQLADAYLAQTTPKDGFTQPKTFSK